MIAPNAALIAMANSAGLPPILSGEHPIVAIQANRAGLGRHQWNRIEGPMTGDGIEQWFQDEVGDIAYSCEHPNRSRLVIFDAQGRPVADVRHAFSRAA